MFGAKILPVIGGERIVRCRVLTPVVKCLVIILAEQHGQAQHVEHVVWPLFASEQVGSKGAPEGPSAKIHRAQLHIEPPTSPYVSHLLFEQRL